MTFCKILSNIDKRLSLINSELQSDCHLLLLWPHHRRKKLLVSSALPRARALPDKQCRPHHHHHTTSHHVTVNGPSPVAGSVLGGLSPSLPPVSICRSNDEPCPALLQPRFARPVRGVTQKFVPHHARLSRTMRSLWTGNGFGSYLIRGCWRACPSPPHYAP